MSMSTLFLVFLTITFTGMFDNRKRLKPLLYLPVVTFVVIILFQKNVAEVEAVFGIFAAVVNVPYLLFAVIIAIINAIKNPNSKSIAYTLGFVMMWASTVADTYYYTQFMVPYTWYIPHGYGFLIATIFFILAKEQTEIYHTSIDRARELEFMKNNLEKLVVQRTVQIEQQSEELRAQAENLTEANNSLSEKNEEINQQNEEIQAIADNLQQTNDTITSMNEELSIVNVEISEKNRKITESIQYALKIQTAIIPNVEFVSMILPQNFILFKPRDIVSGDFYFVKQVKNFTLLAAADCTGHGVPGAFLSMLVQTLLNEIIRKPEIRAANLVLDELRLLIKNTLQQTGERGEQQDGLDIAFCAINLETMQMSYAGAHCPFWLFREENQSGTSEIKLIELSGDRQPVGVFTKETPFTEHTIGLETNDVFYIFSDGYYSQFGDAKNEKFKTSRFKQLLSEICRLPIDEQKTVLEEQFTLWKGEKDQTDDVLVIGVRV